jgi:hypothetical protein
MGSGTLMSSWVGNLAGRSEKRGAGRSEGRVGGEHMELTEVMLVWGGVRVGLRFSSSEL